LCRPAPARAGWHLPRRTFGVIGRRLIDARSARTKPGASRLIFTTPPDAVDSPLGRRKNELELHKSVPLLSETG
jgi:hypothetical protein